MRFCTFARFQSIVLGPATSGTAGTDMPLQDSLSLPSSFVVIVVVQLADTASSGTSRVSAVSQVSVCGIEVARVCVGTYLLPGDLTQK